MNTNRSAAKWILIWIGWIAFWPGAIGSASAAPAPQQTVSAAEKAFNDRDYAAALKGYGELAQKAPYDPILLYDLGTVYAKQGDRGRATWRYLQALKIAPRDSSLVHNLRIVAPEFEQDLGVAPLPPLNALYWRLTANEWTALAGAATAIALLMFALGQLLAPERAIRNSVRRLAWLVLCIAALAWPPAALRYDQEHLQRRGVVVAEGSSAHTEPTAKSLENFNLPAGKIVRVLDHSTPGWLKIGFAGGRIGFVERDKVEFL